MSGLGIWTVGAFAQVATRLLLSSIFLVAGLGKLTDPGASVRMLRTFGAPSIVQPLGIVLAPIEIAVAIGLLFAVSARYAAWCAAGLLAIFIVGIAGNLARGRRPDCNCFGQLRSKPISWRTVLRNATLAAGAMWLAASSGPGADADLWTFLGQLDSRGRRVATVVAALIGFWILHAITRAEPESEPEPERGGGLESRAPGTPAAAAGYEPEPDPVRSAAVAALTGDGLAVGAPAPDFVLPDLEGRQHSLESLRASGTPLLVVFTSPFCESCQVLTPKLPPLFARHEQELRLVLISRGSVEQNRAKLKDAAAVTMLLQRAFEVAEAFDCTSTPAAVVVNADGLIGSPLAVGPLAVQQLVASRLEA